MDGRCQSIGALPLLARAANIHILPWQEGFGCHRRHTPLFAYADERRALACVTFDRCIVGRRDNRRRQSNASGHSARRSWRVDERRLYRPITVAPVISTSCARVCLEKSDASEIMSRQLSDTHPPVISRRRTAPSSPSTTLNPRRRHPGAMAFGVSFPAKLDTMQSFVRLARVDRAAVDG